MSDYKNRKKYSNGFFEFVAVTKEEIEELYKPKKTFQLDMLMWLLLGFTLGTILARFVS